MIYYCLLYLNKAFSRESQTHDLTISVIFGFTWVTKRLKETVIDLHKKSTFTLTKFWYGSTCPLVSKSWSRIYEKFNQQHLKILRFYFYTLQGLYRLLYFIASLVTKIANVVSFKGHWFSYWHRFTINQSKTRNINMNWLEDAFFLLFNFEWKWNGVNSTTK